MADSMVPPGGYPLKAWEWGLVVLVAMWYGVTLWVVANSVGWMIRDAAQ